MNCFYCKRGEMVASVTTHVVDLGHCIVIIRNVPCYECELCGKKEYSDEVMSHLDKIVSEAKNSVADVFLKDYRVAA